MGYRTTKSKIKVESDKANNYTEFYYHFFRNILFISVPLVIVSGFILSSFHISATNSGTDNLTISISSACTLGSVVDIEHNTNTSVGTYTPNIGKTTITTLCNDGNGYSVYANGFSNNEEGNNKLINSAYPQYSIDTGLASSGLTSAWAMKLNNIPDDPSPTPPTIESDYNNTYGIVPSYWTKVASRTSGTTDMAEGSSFTTTYAVYASSSQYAGTYQGQVKYALIHPYENTENLTIEDSFIAHGKNRVPVTGAGEYFTMQDMTTDICNSVSQNGERTTTQLVDIRDNKLYYITKLNDGHCWMTQNLDFNIVVSEEDPTIMKVLTSEDTDLTDHSLTGAYADGYNYDANTGIIAWTPERKTIDFQNTTVTGWVNDNNNPYSANKTDSTGTGHASLGNYYNWTAAIASNNSSSLTQDTISDITKNPKNSICPKGWRLPTISDQPEASSGSTNEFARLNYLYNENLTDTGIELINNPLWFLKGGQINGSNLYSQNSLAYYTSSSIYNQNYSYSFVFDNSRVFPKYSSGTDGTKGSGHSLRCLAR